MVRGLEIWKEFFADYTDNYVLIGGAACNIHEEDFSQTPRATKDLDLILVVEALSAEFGVKFWDFIRLGDYSSRQRGEEKHEYFRFMNPVNGAFPQQVELFSRKAGLLTLPEDARIEPIHIEDGISSLSAILMDDDYYNFTINHSFIYKGVHLANIEALICLKGKAYTDLLARKNNGEQIDSRNIEKHKKDIIRLAAMIFGEDHFDLPSSIREDMERFCNEVAISLPNKDFLKSVGITGITSEELLDTIRRAFL